MLKLNEMIAEVEEWLDQFACNASIQKIIQIRDWEYKEYKVVYTEEWIEESLETLIVYSNGIIKNINGEDVCEIGLSASDDEETSKWIRDFQSKWRNNNG